MPEVYEEFQRNTAILEEKYGDMQDIEFTIQEGKLFMLQTRSGKRCGEAAVRIAVDLVHEGLLDKRQAVTKVHPEHLDQLLHPRFPDTESAAYKGAVIAKGLPASPGAAVGHLAFTDEKVVENEKNGIPSIFVRDEVSWWLLVSVDCLYFVFANVTHAHTIILYMCGFLFTTTTTTIYICLDFTR
jgi:pyruvate,orthophosphate dikinase